jgi:pilus assembly protein Flp/PilA
MSTFRRFVKDDSGATAIEYGLIAALIGVTIIGVVTAVGTEIKNTFTDVQAGLANR